FFQKEIANQAFPAFANTVRISDNRLPNLKSVADERMDQKKPPQQIGRRPEIPMELFVPDRYFLSKKGIELADVELRELYDFRQLRIGESSSHFVPGYTFTVSAGSDE